MHPRPSVQSPRSMTNHCPFFALPHPIQRVRRRLKLKAMGGTIAEREQAVARCLPKLGPKGEQQRLPRVDLTRLLQQLRVGVRCVFLFSP